MLLIFKSATARIEVITRSERGRADLYFYAAGNERPLYKHYEPGQDWHNDVEVLRAATGATPVRLNDGETENSTPQAA